MRFWFEIEEDAERDSFYSEEGINQRQNDDGLADYEAAFMRGYLE